MTRTPAGSRRANRRSPTSSARRHVAALPCDVTDEEQVAALFALAARRTAGLDIVVNNAGLGGTADLVDMTDEQWSRVLDVTLNGTFRCTRAALRAFRGSRPPAASS